jgi:uncharacterized protein (DUF2236 family)
MAGATAADPRALIPPPGGVTWRIASDARVLAAAGYALLLQVAHPTVGAGVGEHSTFRADPWGRLLRTLDFTSSMVYGGAELAAETGSRVRRMHARINGMGADGRRYSALDSEAYAWVHATLADAIVRGNARFVRPIPREELETFWAEWRRLGALLEVDDGELPERWSDFAAYFDRMVAERLADNPTVHDVLDSLASPPPPDLPLLTDPVWKAARIPAARLVRAGTVGLMPPELRAKLGLGWSRAQEVELRALGRASRAAGPLLPAAVKTFGPSYLRWRG